MVTPGALSAASIVAQAFTGPGDRVLVESPGLPQRHPGDPPRRRPARPASPVDPDGWDLDAVGAALRQTAPRLAYLIPDFQNPTGHLMTDAAARAVRRPPAARRAPSPWSTRRTRRWPSTARRCRAPFAAYAPDAITIGSASKTFWGGLRLGWIRAPHGQMDAAHPGPGRPRPRRAGDGAAGARPAARRRRHDRRRAPRAAARAARRARRRGRRAPARLAVPAARPAGWPCGASCPARSAPRWPTRPTGSA